MRAPNVLSARHRRVRRMRRLRADATRSRAGRLQTIARRVERAARGRS